MWTELYSSLRLLKKTMQKQALRIITFSKRDAEYSPLFLQLGLIKFMDLVTMQTAIFTFSIAIIYYLRSFTITLHAYHLNISIILG